MTTQRPPWSFLCFFCTTAATARSLQAPKHSPAGRWPQNPQHQDRRTQRQHVLREGWGEPGRARQSQIHHGVITALQGCQSCRHPPCTRSPWWQQDPQELRWGPAPGDTPA